MSKIAEFLNSIMEELAANEEDREEIEAKAIFLLLNYCPPEEFTPQTEETPLSRRRPRTPEEKFINPN